MTGPEHYKQAETLLAQAMPRDLRNPSPARSTEEWTPAPRFEERQEIIARAQVHATLALTAATALVVDRNGHTEPGRYDLRHQANVGKGGRGVRIGRITGAAVTAEDRSAKWTIGTHPDSGRFGSFPGWCALAGLPADLRSTWPQGVTEREVVRLWIEHRYGHEVDHARFGDFQSCPGATVQQ